MGALNGDPLEIWEGGHQYFHGKHGKAWIPAKDDPFEYAIRRYRIVLVMRTRKFRISPVMIITTPSVNTMALRNAYA